MKKLFKVLLVLPLAFIACNCEISTPKANADQINISCNDYRCITFEAKKIGDITYHIFTSTRHDATVPFVINYTKDSLEIEYYKKQLVK